MSAETAAKIGIAVEFAALLRTLAACLWLAPPAMRPYVTGALIAAVCAALSVALFFWRRYKAAVAVAVGTVAILIAYKVAVFGWRM